MAERDSRNTNLGRNSARTMALGLCSAVVLGGSLPELGNVAVRVWWKGELGEHYFNTWFLALGIIGFAVCGIACYRRLVKAFWDSMEVK